MGNAERLRDKLRAAQARLDGQAKPPEEGPSAVADESPRVDMPAEARIEEIAPEASASAKSLDELRIDFIKAKKDLEATQGIKGRLKEFLSRSSKDTVATAHTEAEDEYKKALAEYVSHDIGRLDAETHKLVLARLELTKGDRSVGKRALDWYKGLGNYNLLSKLEEHGVRVEGRFKRGALRMINVRTAVSAGLLGVAVGFGAGSAIGWGAIVGRRLLSGIGSGVGSRELLLAGLNKMDRNTLKKRLDNAQFAEQVDRLVSDFYARAALDGLSGADLEKDQLYLELVRKQKELKKSVKLSLSVDQSQGVYSSLNEQDKARYNSIWDQIEAVREELHDEPLEYRANDPRLEQLYEMLRSLEISVLTREKPGEFQKMVDQYLAEETQRAESLLKNGKYNERVNRGIANFVGIGVGTIVGSGLLAELFGNKTAIPKDMRPPRGIMHTSDINLSDKELPSAPSVPETNMPGPIMAEQAPLKPLKPLVYQQNADLTEGYKPFEQAAPKTTGLADHPAVGQEVSPKAVETPKNAEIMHHGKATGATLETTAKGEAMLSAGRRGIEGAVLDLKETDPQIYAKMIAKLKSEYPGYSGDDSGLVHKYVLDYAKERGFTVGGNTKDLNEILGAKIHIAADGQLEINPVKFIPPHETLNESATVASKTSDIVQETKPPSAVDFPPENPQQDIQDILDVTEDPLKTRPIRGYLHPVEAIGPKSTEALKAAHEALTIEKARDFAMVGAKINTSEALHVILGDGYKEFLEKNLHLSARSLNKIKDLTFDQFSGRLKAPGSFGEKYSEFGKSFSQLRAGVEFNNSDKMHAIITKIALKRKFEN
ncbi:MAG: hypothetical protein HY336_00960 [Candidatus Doudnabacteria bacterium]|nr:hypothetical protein [Candidatus Doudnabacteria bacterium]